MRRSFRSVGGEGIVRHGRWAVQDGSRLANIRAYTITFYMMRGSLFGAFIIRIGFWGMLFYHYSLSPYIEQVHTV